MRHGIGLLALVLVTGYGCAAPSDEAPKEKTSALPSTTETATNAPTTAPPTGAVTPTPKASESPAPIATTPITPSPKVTGRLELQDLSECLATSGENCIAKPSLTRVPSRGKNAAILKMRGRWHSDLAVPKALGNQYVSCERYERDTHMGVARTWTYTVVSSPKVTGPYGLDAGQSWFEITVSDHARPDDYSVEAIYNFSNGDPFSTSDSTSLINDSPPLVWRWVGSPRVMEFSFRAPAAPEFAYERYNDIGTVLVNGAIRCPEPLR